MSATSPTLPTPSAQAARADHGEGAAPNRRRVHVGLAVGLWRRDLLRLKAERSRWVGVVAQPLLFWALLGSGLHTAFRPEGLTETSYLTFLFPGVVAMVVLFTTVFATMSVIEDRQQGFLQQVLVAPGHPAAFVLGKVAGVTSVALAQVVLASLALPLAGVELASVRWDLWLAAATLGAIGLAASSLVLAWFVRSAAGYHGIMAALLLPAWMVSGALFPPSGGWVGALMVANPMTYQVDALKHALGSTAAAGATVGAGVAFAVLAGFAALTVWGAARVVARGVRTGAARGGRA